MLTCDVEVTHDPVMAILQPLHHGGNHVVAFVEVITRECISHRHLSLHQLFKQHLHIIWGGGEPKMPALELPLQLLLLLLVRLRELGLLLALFALLRKETNNNAKFSNQIPVTKN